MKLSFGIRESLEVIDPQMSAVLKQVELMTPILHEAKGFPCEIKHCERVYCFASDAKRYAGVWGW
jgi:hypothetical protein